jgi:hypothetical protein
VTEDADRELEEPLGRKELCLCHLG